MICSTRDVFPPTAAVTVYEGRITAIDRAGNPEADRWAGKAALMRPSVAQHVAARQHTAVGIAAATRWLAGLAHDTLEGT